ncbi:hypothetical protein JTB14_004234 [Gonioctena quinquepunctata]|nr:hypothetical protein JTB14_004234 [Gonioctena quinquepunctata]
MVERHPITSDNTLKTGCTQFNSAFCTCGGSTCGDFLSPLLVGNLWNHNNQNQKDVRAIHQLQTPYPEGPPVGSTSPPTLLEGSFLGSSNTPSPPMRLGSTLGSSATLSTPAGSPTSSTPIAVGSYLGSTPPPPEWTPPWGPLLPRGRALLEFLSSSNLKILNRGSVPLAQIIVDLRFSFSEPTGNVRNWHVSMEETLADHRHTLFSLAGIAMQETAGIGIPEPPDGTSVRRN